MSNFLANKAKLHGLSKSKIVLVGGIIFALLLLVMLFGVFEGEANNTETSNDAPDSQYNHTDTNGSINEIINEADQNKTKLAASNIILPKVTSSGEDVSVPPIVSVSGQRIKSLGEKPEQANQAQQQFEQKRETNKYGSFSSKSLMFNKPLTNGLDKVNNGMSSTSAASSKSDVSGALNAAAASDTSVDADTNSGKINTNADGGGNNSSGGNGSVNPNQDQNMQAEKHNFVANGGTKNTTYLDAQLQTARSPYEVKAGSIIPATMINGLNSDLPGQIIAQVRENVYDSSTRRYLLIPQGAKLIGLYDSNIAYGQQRIVVIWNRLIYPNGSSISLKGMPGTDLEGYAGFHDLVDNKYWQIFGTSFVIGVLTAAMQYSQNNTNANVQAGGMGFTNTNPTVGQTLSGSLGQQLGQTGLSIAQKNLNVQPTLIIRPNYPFNVMITADMILKPYPKS